MFDFLKPHTEYGKMADSINKINKMIQVLISERGQISDVDEFTYRVLLVAYLVRKGINDRMDKNNWPWETNIMVTSISRKVITLWIAFSKIIDDLTTLTERFELTDKMKAIMDEDDAYLEFERSISEQERRRIYKTFYFQ